MLEQLPEIITAIATSVAVVLTVRKMFKDSQPPIRAIATNEGGVAMVELFIYPATHQLSIRRISCNGAGIAFPRKERDEIGGVIYKPPQDFYPYIDVDLDLLPAHVSSSSRKLCVCIKPRSAQSSLSISFHTSRKWSVVKYKTIAMIKSANE